MIGCFDVAYTDDAAFAACVVFENWQSESAIAEYVAKIDDVAEYVPGQFFRRELPPILKVLESVDEELEILIVDGYVQLGIDRPGLGEKLYHAIDGKIPVIGVAKKSFTGNTVAVEIMRGDSQRRLFVTGVGVSIQEVAENVRHMHGKFRIPKLLKQVDRVVRQAVSDAVGHLQNSQKTQR